MKSHLETENKFPLWSIGQELAESFVTNYSDYTGAGTDVKTTERGKTQVSLTPTQKRTLKRKITIESIKVNKPEDCYKKDHVDE